jgi:hypothetical protein
MKHATPPPLKMAADLVKKFNLDLGPRLSPEQRRDFKRLETLISEAEQYYAHRMAAIKPTAAAAPASAYRRGY